MKKSKTFASAIFIPIVLGIFITLAFAVTTRARFVKSGCSFSGNGLVNSCAASGGASGAYQTITQTIHADAARDLVSNNEILDITVSGATADTWTGDFESITSDATHYVRIHGDISADGAHLGLRDNARFHILHATAAGAIVPVNLTGCSFRIENIQIVPTANNPNAAIGVSIGSGCTTGTQTIMGNIISYEPTGTPTTDTTNNGILISGVGGATRITNIIDDAIWGFTQNGIFLNDGGVGASQQTNILNNTLVANSNFGLAYSVGGTIDTLNMANNYAASNTGGQYFASGSPNVFNHSANISSDATSPDVAFRSKTCTFVNTGTKDYHLVVGDTNCKGQGTDLSANAFFPFSVDWESGARVAPWDITADQYGAIAPTPTPTPSANSCTKGQRCSLCKAGQCGFYQ